MPTQFLQMSKANLKLSIKVFIGKLMRWYKVQPHPMRLYKAKAKALELIRDDHKS